MNDPDEPLKRTADKRSALSEAAAVAYPYCACNTLAGKLSKVHTPSSAQVATANNAAPPATNSPASRRNKCPRRRTDNDDRVDVFRAMLMALYPKLCRLLRAPNYPPRPRKVPA